MTFAPRRFPHTITRRRQEPGERNRAGEYVPGPVIETEFAASVQPQDLEAVNISGEGGRLVERLNVFVPEPDALAAAHRDRLADHVLWNGRDYVVEESRSWPSGHTRATLLDET